MKLSFSNRFVKLPSFAELCRFAYDYGYSGIEISNIPSERHEHADSIFRRDKTQDARRKLINCSTEISAVTFPVPADTNSVDVSEICACIDAAGLSGARFVILKLSDDADVKSVAEKLASAAKKAEKEDVELLFETSGFGADTKNLLALFNAFSSTAVGAAWNVRETFFTAHETPEDTIGSLGAYIRFVRLGDRKNGKNVLIGEGDLPVGDVLDALRSLNYDSFISAEPNDEIDDADIVLTHFSNYLASFTEKHTVKTAQYRNRAGTGVFPWKKYDILEKTFGQVLDTLAETYPDQTAFRYATLDYTRTYSQFRRDVDSVAASFISLGVRPGHHVAVWATNVPEWFLAFWATTKIGAVLVTVNTAYKTHEIEYLLRQSDTHTLITIEGCKDTNYGKIISELCPELSETKRGAPLYAKRLPFLRNVVTVGFSLNGCLTWDEMLEKGRKIPHEEVLRRASLVKPNDVANMQYTSGTTGFPKGVMLTHRNIINNGKTIGDRMDLSTADRMMVQVPMFHCFGMVLTMTSIMTHGGTLCPLPYFSPKSSLSCINTERITCFNGVPTMFLAMFNHPDFDKTDFSHMRTGIMAGANCPPELMRRAAKEMNMTEIVSVYGQTESSPGCTMGEVNEDLDHRVETVGSAFPGVECKIIDPETGRDLPDGENGEFVARGFNIMKGYYKMPRSTAQAIDSDGWLHTGDICSRTPDGYYKVTGRLKDMIIRGGENIYPREIEEFYLTNSKVKDVSVIGVPDKSYGEEACAWIIPKENETLTEDEMKAFGYASIARHKVPRYFIFVKDFPMNAAGKILKYKMKEETVKLLSLN